MNEVRFVTSNFKQEVVIYVDQVFAVTFLPTMKSTVIQSIGGAMVPVEGSVDEVNKKIHEAKVASQPQGEKNGIKKRKR